MTAPITVAGKRLSKLDQERLDAALLELSLVDIKPRFHTRPWPDYPGVFELTESDLEVSHGK